MKVHQQFDLNDRMLHSMRRDGFSIAPHKFEEFIALLSRKGYTIIKSSSYVMGIPQSITLIKETTELIAGNIASKIREDFKAVSERTGIGSIFS